MCNRPPRILRRVNGVTESRSDALTQIHGCRRPIGDDEGCCNWETQKNECVRPPECRCGTEPVPKGEGSGLRELTMCRCPAEDFVRWEAEYKEHLAAQAKELKAQTQKAAAKVNAKYNKVK